MNPFGVAPPPAVDLVAIARWNAGIARARNDYYRSCVTCRKPAEGGRRHCQTCRKEPTS